MSSCKMISVVITNMLVGITFFHLLALCSPVMVSTVALLVLKLCGGIQTQVVKLKKFVKFENTAEALGAAASMVDSKLDKSKWDGSV